MPSRLKVFIVDDEPPAVERLTDMVVSLPGCEVVGCESRGERVLERCKQLQPDIVLLDIEMPGRGGLAIARDLSAMSPAPAIVFVTAHDEFALEAFGVAARDYLVKPVRRERLNKALDRVADRLQQPAPTISAKIGERRIRIPLPEVRAFIAEDKCTVVHSIHGTAVVDEPLKVLETQLGSRFLRTHRNALVSREHVRGVTTAPDSGGRVQLADVEIEPEVSRRNRAAVRTLISGKTMHDSSKIDGEH